jgi:hypothetical protein
MSYEAFKMRMEELDLRSLIRQNPSGLESGSPLCEKVALLTSEAGDRFKRCDEEIQDMHRRIEILEKRKIELQMFRDLYASSMAPIIRLPNELLLRIFEIVGKIDAFVWLDITEVIHGIPALCGVCARWRYLVCRVPSLWSRLRVKSFGRATSNLKHLGALDMSIIRSNSSLLDLSFFTMADTDLRSGTPGFEILRTHLSSRCQSLDLQNGGSLELVLPILWRKLHTLYVRGYRGPSPRSFITLNDSMPELRSLHLSWVPNNFSVGWQRLTYLEVQDLSAGNAHHILQKCTNLQELSLGNMEETLERPEGVITLEHLRVLRLGLRCPGEYGPQKPEEPRILKTLNFPQLQNLEIYISTDGFTEIGAHLTFRELCRSLLRSKCSLTSFTFTGSHVHIPKLQRLLRASPTILSIDISLRHEIIWEDSAAFNASSTEGDGDGDDDVISAWSMDSHLTWSEIFDAFWDEMNPRRSSQSLAEHPVLHPNLTSIAWSDCDIREDTFYERLLEVVSARWYTSIGYTAPVARLLYLELEMDPEMRRQIHSKADTRWQPLRRMKEEGFGFTIRSS